MDLRGAGPATPFVTNVDYNARRQHERIEYANGARTDCEYDPLTFRVTRLRTTRPADAGDVSGRLFASPTVVQDLRHTYDPVGNVTRVEDAALRTVFTNNQAVVPRHLFVYDAIYRLVEASGREHRGRMAAQIDHRIDESASHSSDGSALRNYTERYDYDEVGNILSMAHQANGNGWTRHYGLQSGQQPASDDQPPR